MQKRRSWFGPAHQLTHAQVLGNAQLNNVRSFARRSLSSLAMKRVACPEETGRPCRAISTLAAPCEASVRRQMPSFRATSVNQTRELQVSEELHDPVEHWVYSNTNCSFAVNRRRWISSRLSMRTVSSVGAISTHWKLSGSLCLRL